MTIAIMATVAMSFGAIAFAKQPQAVKVGENDTEFVFQGKCASGQEYRMRAYKDVGVDKYDYAGPMGSGTIESTIPAREAKDFVCQENGKTDWIPDVAKLGEDDVEFVFAGKCANAAPYRLRAYQAMTDGKMREMFDYSGPIGSGTIRSNMPAKDAKAHVCNETAMHAK